LARAVLLPLAYIDAHLILKGNTVHSDCAQRKLVLILLLAASLRDMLWTAHLWIRSRLELSMACACFQAKRR
jgi:hypothetical protein